MSIIINNGIPKESFLLACEICEEDNLSIAYMGATHFADEINDLLALNAFTAGCLGYCFNEEGGAEDLHYQNGKPGYFDDKDKFIGVSFENITNFNLKLDWMIKTITSDFDSTSPHPTREIIPNLLWQIGVADFELEIPIFFARQIRSEDVFFKINKALNDRKSVIEGIILTSCNDLPSSFNPKIANNKIITINQCLSHNKTNFHIDKNILKAAVLKTTKDGFSNGYRSAFFDGERFRFTKQESDVLEFLYLAGKPVHKDEIMAEVTENGTELRVLFRNSDSKNIRQNILKHDNKGYYWLDLV